MKGIWKIVTVVVLVIIILGAALVGIGLLTGADGQRIYQIVDQKYQITELIRLYKIQFNTMINNIAASL